MLRVRAYKYVYVETLTCDHFSLVHTNLPSHQNLGVFFVVRVFYHPLNLNNSRDICKQSNQNSYGDKIQTLSTSMQPIESRCQLWSSSTRWNCNILRYLSSQPRSLVYWFVFFKYCRLGFDLNGHIVVIQQLWL